MNLRVLRKSKTPIEPGDVFAMLPPDGLFLYGRVIATDANPLGSGNGLLLYVDRARAQQDCPAGPGGAGRYLWTAQRPDDR